MKFNFLYNLQSASGTFYLVVQGISRRNLEARKASIDHANSVEC